MDSPRGQIGQRANALSRRHFVGGAAGVGIAAAAAGLVGCSSTNTKGNNAAKPAASGAATAAGTAASAASAATARAGTPAASAAAARSSTPTALDPTKGKPGGTLVLQNQSYHGGLSLVTKSNSTATKIAGLVHSGLLAFDYGRPPSNGVDAGAEPDLAQALPEQPDDVTYVFKLRPAKFQNGRDVTSQDVQYSLDSFAKGDKNGPSAFANQLLWYDHTETPDAQTVVVKTKGPFADGLMSFVALNFFFILAKEFEESPDSPNKLMGSGPYVFDSDTAPVSTVVKKNPNYFNKPYPYFDQITILGANDTAKQIADFTSKQVQLSYFMDAQSSDQVKQSRPDAVEWAYFSTGHAVAPRCDQPPFNDKRVRQALSMAIDRKAIRDATSKGLGEPDQMLSPVMGSKWGFRKPSELGAAAKYWNYDVQSAKQLLQAAGITSPIETQMSHWDPTVVGQSFVDSATLVQAQWKQNNVANVKDIVLTIAQSSTTTAVGNFDGIFFSVSSQQQVVFGSAIKNMFWSPPEGVKPPTPNVGHVNDPQLSALMDKQLTQLAFNDRVQTLHAAEDIIAEQQYRMPLSTYPLNYFTDPTLRDLVVPKWRYGGSDHFVQYWWYA